MGLFRGWRSVKFNMGAFIDKVYFRVLDFYLVIDGISNDPPFFNQFTRVFRAPEGVRSLKLTN